MPPRVDLQRGEPARVPKAMIRRQLDRIGANRASLTAAVGSAVHLGEQNSRAMSVGQVDLFGLERRGGHPHRGMDGRAAAGR